MNDKKNNNSMNKLTDGPLSFQESINLAMNMERIERRRKELNSIGSSIIEVYLILGVLVCFGLTVVIMHFFDISEDAVMPIFITILIIYTVVFILCNVRSSKGSGGKRKK